MEVQEENNRASIYDTFPWALFQSPNLNPPAPNQWLNSFRVPACSDYSTMWTKKNSKTQNFPISMLEFSLTNILILKSIFTYLIKAFGQYWLKVTTQHYPNRSTLQSHCWYRNTASHVLTQIKFQVLINQISQHQITIKWGVSALR